MKIKLILIVLFACIASNVFAWTPISGGGGTGDLIHSGTPANHQIGVFVDSSHIKGVGVTASKPVCTDASAEPTFCAGTEGVWQVAGSYAPAFGTLTNTDLCTTNGTAVACTTPTSTFQTPQTTLAGYGITDALGLHGTADNASQLLGNTWASPAAIGTGTTAAGSFTDLSATGTLGANLAAMTGTCTSSAQWTLGAQWTCTGGVATKAGAGTSTLSVTTTPVVVGKYYKMTANITVSAGTITPSAGGNTMAVISATNASYISYFFAVTTGTPTFTPSSDFAGTVQTTGLQEVSGSTTINDSYFTSTNTKQPMLFKRILSNATGNETAWEFAYQTNKATSGNDNGLLIHMLDTASPGTSYGLNYIVGNTSVFSVDNGGTLNAATEINVTGALGILAADVLKTFNSSPIRIGAYGQTVPSALTSGIAGIGVNSTFTNSTGTNVGLIIPITYAQTSTGGAIDFQILRTETSVGSGPQKMVQAGTAAIPDLYSLYNTGSVVHRGQVKNMAFSKAPITNNTPIDLFTITLAAGESVSGELFYGLTATGGTNDIQEHSGSLYFVCANKGGTFTNAITEAYTNSADTIVKTAGTFTDTWAMKAGNVCTVTLNMNSDLSSAINTVAADIKIMSPKPITLN